MTEPVEIPGHEFLGWGPRATYSGPGWHLAEDYFARCGRCGDPLRLSAEQERAVFLRTALQGRRRASLRVCRWRRKHRHLPTVVVALIAATTDDVELAIVIGSPCHPHAHVAAHRYPHLGRLTNPSGRARSVCHPGGDLSGRMVRGQRHVTRPRRLVQQGLQRVVNAQHRQCAHSCCFRRSDFALSSVGRFGRCWVPFGADVWRRRLLRVGCVPLGITAQRTSSSACSDVWRRRQAAE
jgi:hypothetical protein